MTGAPGAGPSRVRGVSERAQRMLADLLNEARLSVPDDVAALADAQGRALGAHSVSVYLVDREQYLLVPLPTPSQDPRGPFVIDATLAGRCFRQLELQDSDAGGGSGFPCSTARAPRRALAVLPRR